MSRDYLDVEYSATARPMTDYPSLLAAHLALKWDIRSGQTLLDVAAGRAEMSTGFTSLGIKVTALDASPEAEHFAIRGGGGLHFRGNPPERTDASGRCIL